MQEVKIEGLSLGSSDGENVRNLPLNGVTIKKEPGYQNENQEHCDEERNEAETEEEEVSINQFEKNVIEYERDSIKREPEPELIINDLENAFDFEPDDPADANTESESISRENIIHIKPTIESTNEIKTKAKREYKRPHKCLICSKCFTGFNNLSIHMRTHTREKPYFCKKCPKSFVEPYTFRRHKYIHKDKNKMPFPCTVTGCLKTFAHKGHLNQHLLVSHSSHFIPFTCSICTKAYTQKSKLKKHEEEFHNSSYHQDNNTPAKFSQLKRHKESHNNSNHQDNTPAKCSVCSVMFKNSFSLTIHSTRMHKESLNFPYKCTFCTNSYSSEAYFQLHLRKHTDKKSYTCTICSKDFANNSSLTRHSAVVHNLKGTSKVKNGHEKVLKCPVCPKTFSQAGYLKSHVRVHSTVREFSCPFCSVKYRHRPNLNSHLQKKHQI